MEVLFYTGWFTKHAHPLFSSIMQIFKIWFFEILKYFKTIFSIPEIFLLLECHVELQTSVFQMRTVLFNYKLYSRYFFWNFWRFKVKISTCSIWVIKLCVLRIKGPYSNEFIRYGNYGNLKIVVINIR